jgi:hypothetical protein
VGHSEPGCFSSETSVVMAPGPSRSLRRMRARGPLHLSPAQSRVPPTIRPTDRAALPPRDETCLQRFPPLLDLASGPRYRPDSTEAFGLDLPRLRTLRGRGRRAVQRGPRPSASDSTIRRRETRRSSRRRGWARHSHGLRTPGSSFERRAARTGAHTIAGHVSRRPLGDVRRRRTGRRRRQ